MPAKNYYSVLGVSRTATADAIKKARKKKLLENHPDKNDSPEATIATQEINEAYEHLSDPVKKQAHDEELDQPEQQAHQEPEYSYTPGPGFNFTPPSEPSYSQSTIDDEEETETESVHVDFEAILIREIQLQILRLILLSYLIQQLQLLEVSFAYKQTSYSRFGTECFFSIRPQFSLYEDEDERPRAAPAA